MMHQLNIRVDEELFRDLRTAYAHEIERRAGLPRSPHVAWSAFVRQCIRAGLNATTESSITPEHLPEPNHLRAASVPQHGLTRPERRRLEREHRQRAKLC